MAPVGVKYPCGRCGKAVRWNQSAVECEICLKWLHTKCVALIQLSTLDCNTLVRAGVALTVSPQPFHSGTVLLWIRTDPSQNHALTPPRNSLVVDYTNCRSLLPKIDELRLLADDMRLDFIALTETWLDPSIKDCYPPLAWKCHSHPQASEVAPACLWETLPQTPPLPKNSNWHLNHPPICFHPPPLFFCSPPQFLSYLHSLRLF